MPVDTTLYDRLKISPDTKDIDEIKKQGRIMLIKAHPDKHPNNKEKATIQFQEIQEAVIWLGDEDKKAEYDMRGMDAVKGGGEQHFSNPFEDMFGGGDHPFASMFGGGHPQQRNNEERENINTKITVTLEQIYKEEDVEIKYKQKVYCVDCNGEGTNDGTKPTCSACNGAGVRVQMKQVGPMMVQQIQTDCNRCNGKGKVVPDKNKCNGCNGVGHTLKDKTLNIKLQNGMHSGLELKLDGKGHHFKNTKTDLCIRIEEKPHNLFKRNGSDLVINLELKLYQAMFGFDKIVTQLDGRKLHLHHTGITNFGTTRIIEKEGMKDIRSGSMGNLIINFTFTLPVINNTNISSLLKSIETIEVDKEKKVLQDNTVVKTIMKDINNYNADNRQSNENPRQHRQQCQQQ